MSNEQLQLNLPTSVPSFDPSLPYELPKLPPRVSFDDPIFTRALVQARTSLAKLEGLSVRSPNPLLLISPAITRESVASSGIENIHTTVAEVLQADLLPEQERSGVDKEVIRYRDAIIWGAKELKKLPISSRLILGVFDRLMPDHGGHYRKSQNKIEHAGTRQAIYTPPTADRLPALISNWEKFVNSEDPSIDPLIRSIVGHYQFEAIHPFNDGNGRTGRILMVLHLLQKGLLSHPILFISAYLLKERSTYYRTLNQITARGAWNEFVLFMLEAFHIQAEATISTILKIDRLHENTRDLVKKKFPKIYSGDLIDHLFKFPVTTPTKMADELEITYQTASKHLKRLQESGLLRDRWVGTYHFFLNHRLLNISKDE